MDARQIIEWMEYARQEPFGPKRDDYRFAVFMSNWLNANSRRGVRWSVSDVLKMINPFSDQQLMEQRQSLGKRLMSHFVSMAQSLGFKVHDKRQHK